jgi:hypothetical protein
MNGYNRIAGIVAALIALASFASALAFPAVGTCYNGSNGSLPNWFENQNILLFGWLAAFAGQLGWFANIPFVLNIRSIFRSRIPSLSLVSIEASLVALAILSLQPRAGLRLPHNEGYDEEVCFLGPGFWLWVVAHLVVTAVSFALRFGASSKGGDDS